MKKYEFLRKDGTIKKYDFISVFSEGFAAVEENGNWGYIDKDGNEICDIKYQFPHFTVKKDPFLFSEGYVGVGIPNGKFLRFGYLNTKGEEVCPFNYTAVCDFRGGLALVRDEEMKWFVINKEFETVTKRTYDMIGNFYFGCAIVKLNGFYGFINNGGEEMCKIKYKYMSSFGSTGYAQIELPNDDSDKTYWIDTQGKEYYMYHSSNEMYLLN